MIATFHLLITGRVQGVGYRDSMQRQAVAAGCTGWVRNRRDGCVEAVIEGPPEAVDTVVAWARQGPPSARIDRVDLSDAKGGFVRFEVLPTA